jgi:hypothetical protein
MSFDGRVQALIMESIMAQEKLSETAERVTGDRRPGNLL